jgi:hypothetical protein
VSSPADHFRINLNQNLWGLVVSFLALGFAEYYHLPTLFWVSASTSVIMVISVALTTLAYTIHYWKSRRER